MEERYERQLRLPDFGEEGQRKLAEGTVLVVGAGGLGSPALYYLAAAGVRTLRVIDDDCVNESNLQRQILHDTPSIGLSKVSVAQRRLVSLNPGVNVEAVKARLTEENAERLIADVDVVIDAVDNYATKLLLNDICVKLDKPLIYGGIEGYKGQVMAIRQGSANLRTLFSGNPEDKGPVAVFGPVAGIIGSIQAAEAIKILTGIGEVMYDRLMIFDALTGRFMAINI